MTETPDPGSGIPEIRSLLAAKVKDLGTLLNNELLQEMGTALQLIANNDAEFAENNKDLLYTTLKKAGYAEERINTIPLFANYQPKKNGLLGKLLGRDEKESEKSL